MYAYRALARHLRRVRRRMREQSRSGSAIVEFAFLAPPFFLLLFGIIETGVIFFASATLQNATDDVARLIRTGQVHSENMTQTQFVDDHLCPEISALLSCGGNLQVDVEAFNDFSDTAFQSPLMPDGTLNPNLNKWNPGTASQVVLVRVFYEWNIMTPLLSPFLSNLPGGQRLLSATAAFRNEPF